MHNIKLILKFMYKKWILTSIAYEQSTARWRVTSSPPSRCRQRMTLPGSKWDPMCGCVFPERTYNVENIQKGVRKVNVCAAISEH